MFIRATLVTLLLTAGAWAQQDRPDREQLLGNWQVSEGDNAHEMWTIESKGDDLHVVRTDDGKVTLDLKCAPNGSDCKGVDEGKKVTVTMYYNGPALIQMETKDSNVTTRKFALDGKMDRMTIDVNPITGAGKRETLQLSRFTQTAAR